MTCSIIGLLIVDSMDKGGGPRTIRCVESGGWLETAPSNGSRMTNYTHTCHKGDRVTDVWVNYSR